MKTLMTMSIDTKTLVDELRRSAGTVTYEALSASIGRNVTTAARQNLNSARRILLSQEQILFGVVRGVGLRRLSQSEAVGSLRQAIAQVHRTAARGIKRSTAVRNPDDLTPQERTEFFTNIAGLSMISHVTKEAQIKKLSAAVQQRGAALPLQKTLEAFGAANQ